MFALGSISRCGRLLLVAGLITGCASVSVQRTDIADGAKLAVLSNISDRMFINDNGLTIFERQDDAYIRVDGWNLTEFSRQTVMERVKGDRKFELVDNDNDGAEQFAEHIQWTSTNFGKLDDNVERVKAYCAAQGIDYLLLLQPGIAATPTLYLASNRGFGYDQRNLFGKTTAVGVGYAAMLLLYDCESGKEIQSVNEVIWERRDTSQRIEIVDTGFHPVVEAEREEHMQNYMKVIMAAVDEIEVFSLPSSSP